jgi:hypothetical protein
MRKIPPERVLFRKKRPLMVPKWGVILVPSLVAAMRSQIFLFSNLPEPAWLQPATAPHRSGRTRKGDEAIQT